MHELVISHWYTWPDNLSTEVWGPQSSELSVSGSWQLAADNLAAVVGQAFSGSTHLWEALSQDVHADVAMLHLDAALHAPGKLCFTMKLTPLNAWGRMARLSVNGTSATGEVISFQSGSALQVVTLPLPMGLHRITWTWHYQLDMEAVDVGMEAESSGLRLLNISVTHALGAGVTRCELCPAGSEVERSGASCNLCPAGRSSTAYAADGSSLPTSSCKPCPPGRASGTGAVVCRQCGPGLLSHEGASHCRPRPLVELVNPATESVQQWDMQALAEAWQERSWAKIVNGSVVANGSLRAVKVEGWHYFLGLFWPGLKPQLRPIAPGQDAGITASASTSPLAYWWEHLPPLSSLEGQDGSLGSGVCQDNVIEIQSIAESFDSLQPTANDEVLGLWATFSGTCGPSGQQVRRSGIFLRCDPVALPGEPGNTFDRAASVIAGGGAWETPDLNFVEGQRPTSPRGCEDIALEWRTSFACPLCRREDFDAVAVSNCQAGKGRKIAFINKRPCHGGVEEPEAFWEPCGQQAAVTAAIVVPAGLVLCLLGSYVLLLRRRYAKYMQLEEEKGSAVTPTQLGAASNRA